MPATAVRCHGHGTGCVCMQALDLAAAWPACPGEGSCAKLLPQAPRHRSQHLETAVAALIVAFTRVRHVNNGGGMSLFCLICAVFGSLSLAAGAAQAKTKVAYQDSIGRGGSSTEASSSGCSQLRNMPRHTSGTFPPLVSFLTPLTFMSSNCATRGGSSTKGPRPSTRLICIRVHGWGLQDAKRPSTTNTSGMRRA